MGYGVPMVPMHGFVPVGAMPMSAPAPAYPTEPMPKWARPIGTVPVIPLKEPAPRWAFTTPNPWGTAAPIYQMPANFPAVPQALSQPIQPVMVHPSMLPPGAMQPGMMQPMMMQPMMQQPPAQQPQFTQPVMLQQPVASQQPASRYQPIDRKSVV